MRNGSETKVITIRTTVTKTKTVKIESKPEKTQKKADTKERTTTPDTVVVLNRRG